MPRLDAIHRYPVKGLSPERLDAVDLAPGETLPGDRAYAIEQFAGAFDPESPRFLPKSKFLMLARDEKLAALSTSYDGSTGALTISRGGKPVAKGDLTTPVGRGIVEQFFAAYLGPGLRPRVVAAQGHAFTDVPMKCLSLLNLASVRDLARVEGRPVDPLRFRANLHVEGLEPWVEKSWADGAEIRVGDARLRVLRSIVRCAATNVDPATATRDMNIPQTLERAFGANLMGVYVETAAPARIAAGDEVTPP